jgi:hypothetical protein
MIFLGGQEQGQFNLFLERDSTSAILQDKIGIISDSEVTNGTYIIQADSLIPICVA